ncbi:MAG: trypsin-like peptidase domain-containing protein [Clostridiaceae bacterium]
MTRITSLKRLIFITLLFCILISISLSSYASSIYYNDYAVKLSEIGVFKGTGNGFELDREPTRLEGLIMLIRLLGKEEEANQLVKEACVFADVPDWGRGYANYAYKNGLTKGIGNNLFGTYDKMNGQSYVTFLLRSLGYDDSENVRDFTWLESVDFAKSIGLLDEDLYFKIVSSPFLRDYVAKSSYGTLMQPLKNSETTLLQKLVGNGIFTQAQADKLSFENNANTTADTDKILSSIEIGKLADAVVMISAVGYDESTWIGSGFYITQDGNLITNFHVIDGAKTLTITENDGQVYSGAIKIIGYNRDMDIAVLDLDKTVKLYLEPGNSDSVVLGEEVYTIGSPYGLKNTMSNGIISSLLDKGILQISAPISQGSSGGVLLNNKGQAIGIIFAGIQTGENLGFAIPINEYVKMQKNLQLDLISFYNLLSNVPKPANVTWEQIASDTIAVKWDRDDTVDYCKVYISDSRDGEYTEILDENGLGIWTWSANYCLSINSLVPEAPYFVKVIAVKGGYFSQPSYIDSITLTKAFSYEQLEARFREKFGSISINGNTVNFNGVSIYEDTVYDTVEFAFYFDKTNLDAFLKMAPDRDSVERKAAEIASYISNYFNKDASVSFVHSDVYKENPTQFASSNIYTKTVIFLSEAVGWNVCYPYVRVDYDLKSGYYASEWAN